MGKCKKCIVLQSNSEYDWMPEDDKPDNGTYVVVSCGEELPPMIAYWDEEAGDWFDAEDINFLYDIELWKYI